MDDAKDPAADRWKGKWAELPLGWLRKTRRKKEEETMNDILTVILVLAAVVLIPWAIWSANFERVTVWAHELVLHYRKGVLVGRLEAGEHLLWGRGHELKRFDRRWEETAIQGQEFLTADKVPVKVSGLVRYRIADPELHVDASVSAWAILYSAVQIALRDVVGTLGVDAVLERQEDFGVKLKELVAPTAEMLGYELDSVQVRDLMISGDLKRVFTQAVTAKQEALIELEKARGEAAAMRVMANAARVFEQHPSLLQLKFLQTLENGAGYNNQLIMGPLDPLMGFLKK